MDRNNFIYLASGIGIGYFIWKIYTPQNAKNSVIINKNNDEIANVKNYNNQCMLKQKI